jgi:hypothetical protein
VVQGSSEDQRCSVAPGSCLNSAATEQQGTSSLKVHSLHHAPVEMQQRNPAGSLEKGKYTGVNAGMIMKQLQYSPACGGLLCFTHM